MSEYAFALDDTHYIFRLRTGKGEAESVRFYYADRAVMTPKLQFVPLPMEKFRTDRYFDWYEIRLETRFERIAYYFELQNGVETLFYYGDCYEMAGTPTRADYFSSRSTTAPTGSRLRRGRGTPWYTTSSPTASLRGSAWRPTARRPAGAGRCAA